MRTLDWSVLEGLADGTKIDEALVIGRFKGPLVGSSELKFSIIPRYGSDIMILGKYKLKKESEDTTSTRRASIEKKNLRAIGTYTHHRRGAFVGEIQITELEYEL